MNSRTPAGSALTNLILEVFRSNGGLLAAGNRLTKPFGLTSARWQIMGAIELAGRPLTVAQIARRMGLSRQGVQRIVNELEKQKLLLASENIDHKRASLFELTATGSRAMDGIGEAQTKWVNQLADDLDEEEIKQAQKLLKSMSQRLNLPQKVE